MVWKTNSEISSTLQESPEPSLTISVAENVLSDIGFCNHQVEKTNRFVMKSLQLIFLNNIVFLVSGLLKILSSSRKKLFSLRQLIAKKKGIASAEVKVC